MTHEISGRMRDFFNRDVIAQYLGIELLALDSGYAMVRMKIQDKHLNQFGTVHGGVIFTLADIAFGIAGNTGERPAVSIDADVSYMKSTCSGILIAEAREFASQDRFSSFIVEVTDQDHTPIALVQGLAYRKSASTSL